MDRVTYYTPFNFFIVNEHIDHIVIGCLLFLWIIFSFKKSKISYGMIGAYIIIFTGTIISDSSAILGIIALLSLPLSTSLLVFNWRSKRALLTFRYDLLKNYLAIIGIVTGLISLTYAISSVVNGNDLRDPVEPQSYAHIIFLLLSTLSPVLLLLLIACFPVKLLIDYVVRIKIQYIVPSLVPNTISVRERAIYLCLFIILSIIIAFIPHLPTVNEDNRQVGVDTGYYVNWVNALHDSTTAQDFFYQAFIKQGGNGDRPIALIFLFVLNRLTNTDIFLTVEYVPLVLGSALVLVVYFFSRELTSNDIVSLHTAFLSSISFHILIGVYAGFYANWLALIFGYAAFMFLFRFLKKGEKVDIVIYGALLSLTLFSHIYTWSVLAIVSGVYLTVMLKMNFYDRRNVFLLFIVLFSTVAIDLVKTGIIGSSGGIEEDIRLAGELAGPEQFPLRWNNLTYTVTTFVGGLFANFVIFSLGFYWLLKSRIRDPTNIFIMIFLSVGVLPFLFSDWIIQTRIFYNIPFQIPAALALFLIKKHSSILRIMPIYIWLIMASVVSVSNFYPSSLR